MPTLPAPPYPELLYLLAGDQDDFNAACENLRPADIAEAVNQLPLPAAARVVSALPFHLAVQLLDEPELDRRAEIFGLLEQATAVPLLEALSADQRVELFRTLDKTNRGRLFPALSAPTRETLRQLLAYPATSAGGIMT